MTGEILLYLAAFFTFVWGIAHLFPTESVVRGFGTISPDNRRIILMEWIVEGVSLVFVGLLIAVVTRIDRSAPVAQAVYWIAFTELNLLSVVSLFTGFRIRLLPFKLCPLLFTGSAILIALGSFL